MLRLFFLGAQNRPCAGLGIQLVAMSALALKKSQEMALFAAGQVEGMHEGPEGGRRCVALDMACEAMLWKVSHLIREGWVHAG